MKLNTTDKLLIERALRTHEEQALVAANAQPEDKRDITFALLKADALAAAVLATKFREEAK